MPGELSTLWHGDSHTWERSVCSCWGRLPDTQVWLFQHHRGWTHWKISPLVVSLLLGATYEYWRARNAFMGEFDWANVRTLIQGHWIFLCACIVGWYTHLLLDGRFRIFPTDQDHH